MVTNAARPGVGNMDIATNCGRREYYGAAPWGVIEQRSVCVSCRDASSRVGVGMVLPVIL